MANARHRGVHQRAIPISTPARRSGALIGSACRRRAHDAIHGADLPADAWLQTTRPILDCLQLPHCLTLLQIGHEAPRQLRPLINRNGFCDALSLARRREAELTRQFFAFLPRPQVHGLLERFHFEDVAIRRALQDFGLLEGVLHDDKQT